MSIHPEAGIRFKPQIDIKHSTNMKKHLLFILAALLPMLASAQTKVEIDGI